MQKAHFIGIAGKGMSATALLLRERGWQITGSDEGFYPPVSDYLTHAGIIFSNGYKKENIPEDANVIVVGKNAKLVPETNEEVKAAFESGKLVKSFPEIIAELTEGAETIVVAGSYGKSTCTALLAWCLKEGGKDPSYFIGEVTRGFDAYAHTGAGSTFVLEGDEYPSSNWDSSAKFLHYHAKNVLLTSATHDHINVYPTHAEYLAPFHTLLSQMPSDGCLVYNFDEPFAHELAGTPYCPTISYGMTDKACWYPAHITYGAPTVFDLMRAGKKVISLSTTQLGTHNIENIIGVSALLLEKRLVTPEELTLGVASFQGVKRRMELLTPLSRVPVYEGFGSSYEKARSAIDAMRLHFPSERLVVVFEPHTFGWRNRANLNWYTDVFTGAEKVFIAPPETQGAATHDQLTHSEILNAVGVTSEAYEPGHVIDAIRENDAVLILTSGSLEGTIPTLVKGISEKFPL
ncbi:MAG: UDP-N-acetylmuramate--L-alanyl-gamma-D-glutamyl-meso-diaminopimelate ligase [Parcubacteria group bacterium]|nr:UDP-N-acetylmuramate--L-alanyl-gamma-D-glutamyl-meso-diaminopimelate ligase [Parcubacteria group bacterium]